MLILGLLPYFNQKMNKLKTFRCVNFVHAQFSDLNAFALSKRARQAACLNEAHFTYGEINLLAFATLLKMVKPKHHEIFYDLGCGLGKTVLLCARLYPKISAKGVEQLDKLVEEGQKRVAGHNNIQLIAEDIFQYDFTNADIIFLNATGFRGKYWDNLQSKLASLKSGTRLIVTSKKLDPLKFQLQSRGMWPMSWGMNSVAIYRKI